MPNHEHKRSLLLNPTLSLIPCPAWFNTIYITVLHIQEVGETRHLGGLTYTNNSRDVQAFLVLFCSLGQRPSLRYFLSSPSSVSLSMGCHGVTQAEHPSLPCDLHVSSCVWHYLFIFPSYFHIVTFFIMTCACVCLSTCADMSRANMIWLAFAHSLLTRHTLCFMSPLLPLAHIEFFLSLCSARLLYSHSCHLPPPRVPISQRFHL